MRGGRVCARGTSSRCTVVGRLPEEWLLVSELADFRRFNGGSDIVPVNTK